MKEVRQKKQCILSIYIKCQQCWKGQLINSDHKFNLKNYVTFLSDISPALLISFYLAVHSEAQFWCKLVSELSSQYLLQHRNMFHSDSVPPPPPPQERLDVLEDIPILMRKNPDTTSWSIEFLRKWNPVPQLPLDCWYQNMVSLMMELCWKRSRCFPFPEISPGKAVDLER